MVSSLELRVEVTKHQGASVTKLENSQPDRRNPVIPWNPFTCCHTRMFTHPRQVLHLRWVKASNPFLYLQTILLAWKAKHEIQNQKNWAYFLKQFISEPWKKTWSAGTSACLSRLLFECQSEYQTSVDFKSNRRQCQLCLLRAVLSNNESLHTTVNVRPRSMAPK